jgi:O-antigen ligase
MKTEIWNGSSMTHRLRAAQPWLAALAASCAVGVIAARRPEAAVALVLLAMVAALAARVRDVTLVTIYVGALTLTSALVDLPGKVQLGANTSNALLTIAYAGLGILAAIMWRRSPGNSAPRPLMPFAILVGGGALATLVFPTTLAGIQNLLVLIVFVCAALAAIGVVNERRTESIAFAEKLFGLAAAIALCLYAGSLALGGIGSGAVIGNRSFGLFGLVMIAWAASGWRYGVRRAGTLALLTAAFILLSLSRTAFAATLLVLCVVWIDPRTTRGWLRPLGAAAAAIATAYAASVYIKPLHDRIYTGDLQQITGGIALNVTGRTDLWGTTWRSYLNAPYFGHGVGSADTLITRVYGSGIGHPHNDYLRILHDYGAVGGMLWFVGYAWLLRATWRAWQRPIAERTVVSEPQEEGRLELSASGREHMRHRPELRVHAAAFLSLFGVALAMITDNVISYLFVMGPVGVLVGLSLGLTYCTPAGADSRRQINFRRRARRGLRAPTARPSSLAGEEGQ